MTEGCSLCAQVAGYRPADLLEQLLGDGHYRLRNVPIGERFVAIPSLGALVEGHVLLCPRVHARSFASLEGFEDAAAAVAILSDALARHTGAAMQIFEHGNARAGSRVSCSVEHAHLHFVPGAPSLWSRVRHLADWQYLPLGLRGLQEAVGDREYVLVADPSGHHRVATPSTRAGFSSQWLRRVLAEAIGRPEDWNWRESPNPALTAKSWELLQAALQSRGDAIAA